jgi:hypothetical protein
VRNIKLVDYVIALHEIAREVLEETGDSTLSEDIHKCADRVHELSIIDGKNSIIADNIINKAKE